MCCLAAKLCSSRPSKAPADKPVHPVKRALHCMSLQHGPHLQLAAQHGQRLILARHQVPAAQRRQVVERLAPGPAHQRLHAERATSRPGSRRHWAAWHSQRNDWSDCFSTRAGSLLHRAYKHLQERTYAMDAMDAYQQQPLLLRTAHGTHGHENICHMRAPADLSKLCDTRAQYEPKNAMTARSTVWRRRVPIKQNTGR